MPAPRIRPAIAADLPAILELYNEVIAHTDAVYLDEPQVLAEREQWFARLRAGGWPVLVAELDGAIAGFGNIGPFREKSGYRFTGEHTLHVRADLRGRGIGRALLTALVAEAGKRGLHVLVGGIDAGNTASLDLHASLGFTETARMMQVAIKGGRWLDLVLLQLILPGPERPGP